MVKAAVFFEICVEFRFHVDCTLKQKALYTTQFFLAAFSNFSAIKISHSRQLCCYVRQSSIKAACM